MLIASASPRRAIALDQSEMFHGRQGAQLFQCIGTIAVWVRRERNTDGGDGDRYPLYPYQAVPEYAEELT